MKKGGAGHGCLSIRSPPFPYPRGDAEEEWQERIKIAIEHREPSGWTQQRESWPHRENLKSDKTTSNCRSFKARAMVACLPGGSVPRAGARGDVYDVWQERTRISIEKLRSPDRSAISSAISRSRRDLQRCIDVGNCTAFLTTLGRKRPLPRAPTHAVIAL